MARLASSVLEHTLDSLAPVGGLWAPWQRSWVILLRKDTKPELKGVLDVRIDGHNMACNITLAFLGTSSAQPSLTRNLSCSVVQIDGSLWMFDCGEGTQTQVMKFDATRMSRLRRIFITHLHGDHIFGIPGLMCTLASAINQPDFCLNLYGPSGLRKFVRSALSTSYARLTYKFSVHELIRYETELDPDHDCHPDEIPGADVRPDSDGIWNVVHSDHIAVRAASIEHRIPSLGYVLQEDQIPGRLLIADLQPILKQHDVWLRQAYGVKNPMSLLANFKSGLPIRLPDGSTLLPESFVAPPKVARKIVILGDTCDPSGIAAIAADADILVHEATNAFLKQDTGTTTREGVRQLCISHGHSTPEMAGEFARSTNAKSLVLNHFSSRYRGDNSEDALAVMEEIRQLAMRSFGCDRVFVARDLQAIDIRRRDLRCPQLS